MGIHLNLTEEQVSLMSPKVRFGQADSIFLRTSARVDKLRNFGFNLRIYYLGANLKTVRRVNFLRKGIDPEEAENGEINIIYFDRRLADEDAFYLELLIWRHQNISDLAAEDYLAVEDFRLVPSAQSRLGIGTREERSNLIPHEGPRRLHLQKAEETTNDGIGAFAPQG